MEKQSGLEKTLIYTTRGKYVVQIKVHATTVSMDFFHQHYFLTHVSPKKVKGSPAGLSHHLVFTTAW